MHFGGCVGDSELFQGLNLFRRHPNVYLQRTHAVNSIRAEIWGLFNQPDDSTEEAPLLIIFLHDRRYAKVPRPPTTLLVRKKISVLRNYYYASGSNICRYRN